ncbi:hypothetical protein Mgra_00008205 [Meloidogyne graminicola]|uniref:Transcription elongation regulator 1 n=1 Tax=Meloidogyne graminicola TaxID=189291 RepID=A0A8S9ZGM0_9BILA|nr:hypothetical protein Mgra_00008205 [Meloidogyne graminicola]
MLQQHGGGPSPVGMHPPFMMPPGFPGGPTNPNEAWQEFTAQDGKKYYYNFLTRENTWTKPKALIDKEAAIRENGGVPPPNMGGFPGMMGGMSPIGIGYAGFRPSTATGGPQAALANPQAGQKDKSRPVTSNAVAGTPWCVVWTGDNRVFFFNPSTRTSVWERPPELYNRPDVDLLVSKPPPAKEQLSNRAQKRLQKEESEEEEVEEDDDVEGQDSDTSNSDEEQQRKIPAKSPKKKSRKEKRSGAELKTQSDNHKQPKLALPVLQQEKPIDPAIQAELEAQREREKIPLEERIKQFRQLLEDKKVSATSTWEKELSKIVFDQRYLLLSAVERKAAFDAFCKERAEIEKEEKRKRAKEAKAEFTKLLEEANLHGKSTFSSFSTKWSKDTRFKGVDKARDREGFFKDYVEQLYKKEKEEKRKEREKAKEAFVSFLKEQEDLRRNSNWAIVKKKLDKDERYRNKNLDSETRQKLFDEHIKTCPEPTEEEEAEAKRLENEALEAANAAKEKALIEQQANEERDKERRKSSTNNNSSSSSRRRDKEKEKAEKIVEKTAEEKALEDRKRQVEEELGEHLKERNREHERHKLLEHEQNFKALLLDLIKNTDIGWHDGRKILKKDSRYQNCEFLDKESKERHFREHIRDLERKKRDVFFQLLDEHQHITFTTKWHNAKKTIVEDERFSKLKIDERKLENEYRDWMDRRHRQALDDFEALLRETKIITYKSKQMITENEQHLRDILAVLENDTRYLVLKDRPNERERILDEYLDLLDRKGPPPPPTRNEDPDRRRK